MKNEIKKEVKVNLLSAELFVCGVILFCGLFFIDTAKEEILVDLCQEQPQLMGCFDPNYK